MARSTTERQSSHLAMIKLAASCRIERTCIYMYIYNTSGHTCTLTESLSGSDDCLACFLRGSSFLIKEGPDSNTAVTGSLERRRPRGRWVGDLLGERIGRLRGSFSSLDSPLGACGAAGVGDWQGVFAGELPGAGLDTGFREETGE